MAPRMINLTELYSEDELRDDNEILFHHLPEDVEGTNFEVRQMPASGLVRVLTPLGDVSLVQAFSDHADADQKELVREKMRSFDQDRIVVLNELRAIDGNHHLIAAFLSRQPVLFIDLSRPVPRTDPNPS